MYLGYQPLFSALDLKIRTLALRPENNYSLDPDELLALATPATRAVLINTPGNPCGNVVSKATLSTLASGCRERNLWLVCDEVYSLITFERPHVSLLKATMTLDNIVVIDGLSKSHAMSGWRIGWAVAPTELVDALGKMSETIFFGCPQFVQDGAAYALAHDEPFVAKMRDEYRLRRNVVVERIDAINGLSCWCPDAGMFVMVDVRKVAADGEAFARDMLDNVGVSVIPGRGFGPSAAGFVRVGLTQPVEVLEEACARIGRACGSGL
jgi:arginine:pyruvate transaminase